MWLLPGIFTRPIEGGDENAPNALSRISAPPSAPSTSDPYPRGSWSHLQSLVKTFFLNFRFWNPHEKSGGKKPLKNLRDLKKKWKKKAVYRIGGNFSRTHSVRVDKQQREGIKWKLKMIFEKKKWILRERERLWEKGNEDVGGKRKKNVDLIRDKYLRMQLYKILSSSRGMTTFKVLNAGVRLNYWVMKGPSFSSGKVMFGFLLNWVSCLSSWIFEQRT